MTRIALLRHFPTDWNRENRLQGQIDRPLLPESRERLAGLALPPPWDRTPILASTLSRSRDTAASLSAGRPVTEDPRLVEISWGDWEGCLGEDLLADPVSDYVPIEQWGWSRRPPNGESPADAWARIAPVLAEIAEASPTLLIIHRAIMRVILARAHGWNYESPEPFKIKLATVYPLDLTPDGMPTGPGEPVPLVPR